MLLNSIINILVALYCRNRNVQNELYCRLRLRTAAYGFPLRKRVVTQLGIAQNVNKWPRR